MKNLFVTILVMLAFSGVARANDINSILGKTDGVIELDAAEMNETSGAGFSRIDQFNLSQVIINQYTSARSEAYGDAVGVAVSQATGIVNNIGVQTNSNVSPVITVTPVIKVF